jgi:hypothetical protein
MQLQSSLMNLLKRQYPEQSLEEHRNLLETVRKWYQEYDTLDCLKGSDGGV